MRAGIAVVVLSACAARHAQTAPPPAIGWLKGQTHVHSANSGDSATPPADVARWYAKHGYDFVVFTDHNVITTLPPHAAGELITIPGVELTQNLETCDPPPAPGEACLLHVNALFVRPGGLDWPAATSDQGEQREGAERPQ